MPQICVLLGPVVADELAQSSLQRCAHLRLAGGSAHTDHRPNQIEDQVVRQRLTIREATAFDPSKSAVAALDLRAQLGEQPALPDARLAEDGGESALARPGD